MSRSIAYMLAVAAMLLTFTAAVGATDSTLVLLGFDGNALSVVNQNIDDCNNVSYVTDGSLVYGMQTTNACAVADTTNTTASAGIRYDAPLNLTYGPIIQGDIQTGENWLYVDSLARPDLDKPALLIFTNHKFVAPPVASRNGVPCTPSDCNITSFTAKEVDVSVAGFSNYSLTARKDFIVYSDDQPELKDKTYQSVDLGDGNRSTEFACTVQIFGQNQNNEWVLIQTNPERAVQSRMFGSPDMNQPESLGYFPTKNGVANTYFRGNDNIYGYNDLELLVQCSSNQTSYYYEEPISTRYSPIGRGAVSRGIWLTDGANGFYLAIYIVGGLIALWLLVMVYRRTFRK